MSDQVAPAKNKGGRPQKYPGENRTAHTFRLREKNRVRLMRDAEANGRSMSEEIEARIEEALDADVQIAPIFRNRRNYARIAAILEAMERAEAVQNPVIETDDDRECFKTLAAIEVLNRYAAFYGRGREDYVLRPLFSVEPHNSFVDRVLMQIDPYFATWHGEPEIASKADMKGSDTQVRQETATLVKIVDAQPPKQRRKKITTA